MEPPYPRPGLIARDVYGHGGWAGTQFWVHPSAGVAWVLDHRVGVTDEVRGGWGEPNIDLTG